MNTVAQAAPVVNPLPDYLRDFYLRIRRLTRRYGYCFARNNYFCGQFQRGQQTISRWIARLVQAGYIRCETAITEGGTERHIFLTQDCVPPKRTRPARKCVPPPSSLLDSEKSKNTAPPALAPEPDASPVVASLMQNEIPRPEAERLAATYGERACLTQIAALRYHRIDRNRGGFLRRAIEGAWAVPEAAKQAERAKTLRPRFEAQERPQEALRAKFSEGVKQGAAAIAEVCNLRGLLRGAGGSRSPRPPESSPL